MYRKSREGIFPKSIAIMTCQKQSGRNQAFAPSVQPSPSCGRDGRKRQGGGNLRPPRGVAWCRVAWRGVAWRAARSRGLVTWRRATKAGPSHAVSYTGPRFSVTCLLRSWGPPKGRRRCPLPPRLPLPPRAPRHPPLPRGSPGSGFGLGEILQHSRLQARLPQPRPPVAKYTRTGHSGNGQDIGQDIVRGTHAPDT